jgi:hypothetical protein
MNRRAWLFLLAAAVVVVGTDHAGAQSAASLSVDPAEQAVTPDTASFEVRLLVDDVTAPRGLGGYTLVMEYDPSVVQGVVITDSGYLESTLSTVLCPSSATDNDAGRLAHFCFTVPIFGEEGLKPTEPQVLAHITLKPAGEGTTELDIRETELLDPEGNAIEATTTNGEVSVTSGPMSVETSPAEAEEAVDETGRRGNIALYAGLGAGLAALVVVLGASLVIWRGRRTGA